MNKPNIPFEPWPKIHRLERDIVVTEKIDGTNAGILVVPEGGELDLGGPAGVDAGIYASSRSRWIAPGEDSFGFAAWVEKNAETLIADLGPGMHFGEWWGSGIQRGYGLTKGEKRFSLFNTRLWGPKIEEHEETTISINHRFLTPGVACTPILYEGSFSPEDRETPWGYAKHLLEKDGSRAAAGFMKPEGIVLFHKASRQCFKWTFGGDGAKAALRQQGERC